MEYYFVKDDSGKRNDEGFKRILTSPEDNAIKRFIQYSDEIIKYHKERAYIFVELHEKLQELKDACDEYLENRLKDDPEDVIFDEFGWSYKIIRSDE